MAGPDQYVGLMASLPSSERLFFAKQPPISRLRLERRLSLLTPPHAATLATIEAAMRWGSYRLDTTDAEAIARIGAALTTIREPTLNDILRERFELRVAVAALRLRARGDDPATAGAALGRWGRRLVENWSAPAFKMSRRHPWLPKAAALLGERDAKGFERHVLETTFRQLQRRAAFHHFDFEAVVIYVLKWSIFERWARANTEAAARRFDQLTNTALSDFPAYQSNGERDAVDRP